MSATNLFLKSKTLLKLATRLHILVYRLTAGHLGGMTAGVPNLLLTTRGRKSGRHFTTPLCWLSEGASYVVVASYGGSPRDPDWWLNLKHDPQGQIQIGPHRWKVRAEQASAEVKARLWPAFCRLYPDYVEYQRRTSRDIPLVLLHPEA